MEIVIPTSATGYYIKVKGILFGRLWVKERKEVGAENRQALRDIRGGK
jgi:hypothetical protein